MRTVSAVAWSVAWPARHRERPAEHREVAAIAAYDSTGQFRWGLHRVLAGLSDS
ncbi:hypothetical protein [Acrocarpospora phusangensis]|uniref:hypothetical protein n=1 Tax=Acrocarpospora phusangensis TaxID=1070424 RepID=UPI00195078A1|nr:hypothetical protein [Acrocarpospora phusangensis]